MKHTFFLIALITLLGCNSNKQTTENTTPSMDQNTKPADPNDRFSVSFISIGAGTDGKSKDQFDQFIPVFEQKNKVKLKYEAIPWGREGEVDYCFDLTGLDTKKQTQFIAETKDLLKGSTLVQYKENEPCQQKRN